MAKKWKFKLSRSNNYLILIPVPSLGYSVPYLRDHSGLGQALAYIRPLQARLDLSPAEVDQIERPQPEELPGSSREMKRPQPEELPGSSRSREMKRPQPEELPGSSTSREMKRPQPEELPGSSRSREQPLGACMEESPEYERSFDREEQTRAIFPFLFHEGCSSHQETGWKRFIICIW